MLNNDYIFIKGKNHELSRFEIVSYLDARGFEYNMILDKGEFLVIRVSDDLNIGKMINSLGGTLKIAKIIMTTKKDELKKALDEIEIEGIFKLKTEKFIFGVSVYSEKDSYRIYRLIGSYFKKRLKQKGWKTKYFGFPRKRKPQLTNVEIIKKNLIENSAEIIVCLSDKVYIGATVSVHNPFEFQKRDIERPAQRTIFSIPPRLSKILINLSRAKEGDTLLDPFCGVGTILQEALLDGINIIGIDIDEECIKSSKENLRWVSKEYNLVLDNLDKKIKIGDAKRLSEYFKEGSIDSIATEPYLGPPLKKKPSIEEVGKIFEEIKPLYEDSLEEMYKILKPKKRIAIVSPCMKITKTKYVKFDFQSIATKIGFKIINSFIDVERRHKTFREIFVIEK